MSYYIHEQPDWPRFRWTRETLVDRLATTCRRQGRLIGRMESLGFPFRAEAVLQTLAQDVLRSSEIEGEILDKDQVRSSIARRLGMDIGALTPADRHVEGMVEMTLDATQRFDSPLTAERLFGWHAALFPTNWSGLRRIKVAAWRDDETGPMQVVSGPIGRERVRFQAPAAERIDGEMTAFLDWFDGKATIDPILKAGLAHLWFVTIHPFDDGNGRIAARSPTWPWPVRSKVRNAFTACPPKSIWNGTRIMKSWRRRSAGRSTSPLGWNGSSAASIAQFDGAETTLAGVLRKARFWKDHADAPLNSRQRLVLNRLLDGFEGKLTSSKWAKLAKCSQDTALRDILDLVDRGILGKDLAGGRSTSYSLVS